jgi:hypothetical protein
MLRRYIHVHRFVTGVRGGEKYWSANRKATLAFSNNLLPLSWQPYIQYSRDIKQLVEILKSAVVEDDKN